MKTIAKIVFVGLLMWSAPAGAKTYSLTVSVHKDVAELNRDEVKAILKRASRIMHKAHCDVTFTLDGDIGRFEAFADDPLPGREIERDELQLARLRIGQRHTRAVALHHTTYSG